MTLEERLRKLHGRCTGYCETQHPCRDLLWAFVAARAALEAAADCCRIDYGSHVAWRGGEAIHVSIRALLDAPAAEGG